MSSSLQVIILNHGLKPLDICPSNYLLRVNLVTAHLLRAQLCVKNEITDKIIPALGELPIWLTRGNAIQAINVQKHLASKQLRLKDTFLHKACEPKNGSGVGVNQERGSR